MAKLKKHKTSTWRTFAILPVGGACLLALIIALSSCDKIRQEFNELTGATGQSKDTPDDGEADVPGSSKGGDGQASGDGSGSDISGGADDVDNQSGSRLDTSNDDSSPTRVNGTLLGGNNDNSNNNDSQSGDKKDDKKPAENVSCTASTPNQYERDGGVAGKGECQNLTVGQRYTIAVSGDTMSGFGFPSFRVQGLNDPLSNQISWCSNAVQATVAELRCSFVAKEISAAVYIFDENQMVAPTLVPILGIFEGGYQVEQKAMAIDSGEAPGEVAISGLDKATYSRYTFNNNTDWDAQENSGIAVLTRVVIFPNDEKQAVRAKVIADEGTLLVNYCGPELTVHSPSGRLGIICEKRGNSGFYRYNRLEVRVYPRGIGNDDSEAPYLATISNGGAAYTIAVETYTP